MPSSGASTTSGSPVRQPVREDLAGRRARAAGTATARSAPACRRRSRRRTGAAATAAKPAARRPTARPGPSSRAACVPGVVPAGTATRRSRRTAAARRVRRASAARASGRARAPSARPAGCAPADGGHGGGVARAICHRQRQRAQCASGRSSGRASRPWRCRRVRGGPSPCREQRDARSIERGHRLVEKPQRPLSSDRRARPMRRRCPCDSTRAGSVRLRVERDVVKRGAHDSRGTVRRPARPATRRFSSAVSSSFSAGRWPANAMSSRSIGAKGATSAPRQRTSPAAGATGRPGCAAASSCPCRWRRSPPAPSRLDAEGQTPEKRREAAPRGEFDGFEHGMAADSAMGRGWEEDPCAKVEDARKTVAIIADAPLWVLRRVKVGVRGARCRAPRLVSSNRWAAAMMPPGPVPRALRAPRRGMETIMYHASGRKSRVGRMVCWAFLVCATTVAIAATPSASEQANALFAEYWDWQMRERPTYATYVGDHRFDHRMSEASERAIARRKAFVADLAQRLAQIDRSGFPVRRPCPTWCWRQRSTSRSGGTPCLPSRPPQVPMLGCR